MTILRSLIIMALFRHFEVSGSYGFPTTETVGYCFGGSKELQYHSPLCLSTEKISSRGKVIRTDSLEQDTCAVYKWVGKGVLCPENLLGYSFIIKGKMGRGRRASLTFLSRRPVFIISSSSRLSTGVFPFSVKLGPQMIVFYVCREHVLRIINLLSSLGRMWSHATIVSLFGGMPRASAAWFCC